MGRPSVRAERREQILDAMELVVAEHGLEGATLARIAGKADVAPSAIAHFVGNRAELVEAALERSADHYAALVRSLEGEPLGEILDHLISARRRKVRPTAMVIFDEMVALAPRDHSAHERLVDAYATLDDLLADAIEEKFPDASNEQQRTLRYTLLALIDNVERLVILGIVPERARRDFRRAADALIEGVMNP